MSDIRQFSIICPVTGRVCQWYNLSDGCTSECCPPKPITVTTTWGDSEGNHGETVTTMEGNDAIQLYTKAYDKADEVVI